MKVRVRHDAMEELCRRHALLDSATAEFWLEEAELWSKLKVVEERLKILTARPDNQQGKSSSKAAY